VLRDLGDKVPSDLKTQVEDKVAQVRQVMNSDDTETIRKATEELNQVVQKIGEAAYQQAEPSPGEPGVETEPGSEPDTGESTNGEDDVVDGEFA